jgi:hypothetical protein
MGMYTGVHLMGMYTGVHLMGVYLMKTSKR